MKKLILAIAVMALASMSVAAFASAGGGNQAATGLTVTGTFNGTAYVHTYTIDTKPNGSFTGTGGMPELGLQETITGTLHGQNISINSVYKTYNTPFNWSYSGPLSGGGTYIDPLNQDVKVTVEVTTASDYKNHGDYVSSQGGGPDAAHSPIGMPIH